MLTLPHLNYHQQRDPRLGETLKAIQTAINGMGTKAGIDPVGAFPPPTAPAQINVTATNGWFDVTLLDPDPQRGVQYFVESDTNPSFPAPRTYPLGTSRTFYHQLGNQTLYWRGYSQYPGSDPSGYVIFGGANPVAVTGGGASGPPPQPTQGTGAGPSAGSNPNPPTGVGYGRIGNLRNKTL